MSLPRLIATSVVRGSDQGQSHGGIFIVDMESGTARQVYDWDRGDIDFSGRGWDRGLRGIAIDGEDIYVAASDEIFVFDPQFRIRRSFRNPYLRHCHEICLWQRKLFLTSTGFDAILAHDLDEDRTFWGVQLLRGADGSFSARGFDPGKEGGPAMSQELHINMIHCDGRGMFVSGRHTGCMIRIAGGQIGLAARLPLLVHNARPWKEGLLVNDTAGDHVRYLWNGGAAAVPVPRYPDEALEMNGVDSSMIARQAFGRGLCVLDDDCIAAGSSPSTVSIHDMTRQQTVRSVNFSMDVRNAVHGLEVWPFD